MSFKFKLCTFKFYGLAVSLVFFCCENDSVHQIWKAIFVEAKNLCTKGKKCLTFFNNEISFNSYKIRNVLEIP